MQRAYSAPAPSGLAGFPGATSVHGMANTVHDQAVVAASLHSELLAAHIQSLELQLALVKLSLAG